MGVLTRVEPHALDVVQLLLDAFPCSTAVSSLLRITGRLISVVPSEAVCEDLVDRALTKLVRGERNYTGQKAEPQYGSPQHGSRFKSTKSRGGGPSRE